MSAAAGTEPSRVHRGRMIRACLFAAAASALAINLGGCDRQTPAPAQAPASEASLDPSPFARDSAAPAPSATPTADVATPGEPSASRDPEEVLDAWARAVELRDWKTVRAYWGDHGERSSLTPEAFAARWSALLDPRVTVAKGAAEGAAGSTYYTAPVRIIDGPRTLHGKIVLRRVNDVPGADAEQLRWHIESTTIEP